ncbi:transposable element Tc1 transposase [Trichonephila clavipes]|nr:transposable element Tc1 transposase [Trichonephila clavipes]
MGRSHAAIRRCWKEEVENGRFQRHDGNGRSRATSDQEDRLISEICARTDHYAACHLRLHIVEPDYRDAYARSDWNHADWGPIAFSSESRFQPCPDDHRGHVRRIPGQRADPFFTIARHTSPQQGVTVWCTISFDSRALLVIIRAYLQHSGTSTTF